MIYKKQIYTIDEADLGLKSFENFPGSTPSILLSSDVKPPHGRFDSRYSLYVISVSHTEILKKLKGIYVKKSIIFVFSPY